VREPAQDLAVDAALAAGAYGASMLVDEPGRPVAVLADPAKIGAVRAYVSDAFRCEGVSAPRYLTIKPSAGATRITP
jgi:galactokinase